MSPSDAFGLAASETGQSPYLAFLKQWGPALGELSDFGKIAVIAARRFDDTQSSQNWQNSMAGFWDRFNLSAAFFELMRDKGASPQPVTNLGRLLLIYHPAFQPGVGTEAQRDAKETLMSGMHAVATYAHRDDIALSIVALAAKHGVSIREKGVLLEKVRGQAPTLKPVQRQVKSLAEERHEQQEFQGRSLQPRLQEKTGLATAQEWEARMGFPTEVTTRGPHGGLVGMHVSWLNAGQQPVEGRETLSGPERLDALNKNPGQVGGTSQAEKVDRTDGPMKVAVAANARRTKLPRGQVKVEAYTKGVS